MMIKLELLSETDFSQIVEWVNQYPEDFLVQWAGTTYEYPLTIEQMKGHYSNGHNSVESAVFIYKIMDDNRFIGSFQLGRLNWVTKEAIVGRFLIGEEINRGRGIGRIALNELVKIGFNQFNLETIKLNVYEFNRQAIKCYESIGFRKSLYQEKMYQNSNGFWWNNFEMTLRKEDWLV
ncbi:MAG: GNAT family protein [Candidatus Cohnella colombiensis]|uniref:GNAT family protein n=1 Tax=Candidatus Cohnella colombiensis TaxID=3121368 RepID=A0AA95F045_9BACL|nr:MAG: GNAT family protein [Cohnella sp.]